MATVTAGQTFISGETVTPAKLNSLGLPTVALATDEVTTTKILNAAVTADKLATGAVTGAAGGGKVAASAITGQTAIADALADGDEFLVHDTSASALRRVAWSAMRTSGTPLQMQQAVKTDTQTISTASGVWTDVTGLSLTLTRAVASASGRVRVQGSILCSDAGGNPTAFRIVRGSTEIGIGDAAGNRMRATAQAGSPGGNGMASVSIDFIDSSPGSSATVTYKIQARSYQTTYINRSSSDTDVTDYIYRGISTLTLTELAP